eukprot:3284647-Rhodomonas_salina.1
MAFAYRSAGRAGRRVWGCVVYCDGSMAFAYGLLGFAYGSMGHTRTGVRGVLTHARMGLPNASPRVYAAQRVLTPRSSSGTARYPATRTLRTA